MINIHIITQNEPFYIPKMVKYILANQNEYYKVSSFTVLKPTRKSKSMMFWFKERAKIYSLQELFIVGLTFLYTKVNSKFRGRKSWFSVRNIFSRFGIKEIISNDINSAEYLEKIAHFNLDVIVSISCPQLFKEEILKIPNKHCVNAHGTLLPRHRGVFGTFWTLFNNDVEAGATIHTMEIKLDAGEILWQESFPVENGDTQYSLAYKTKKNMALGLVSLFQEINKGEEKALTPMYDMSYHRAPSKVEGVKFHKEGKRIIKLKDLKNIINGFY